MPYHGNQLFPLGDDAPPRKLPEPDGVAFNIVPQDGSSSQTKSKVEMVEIKKNKWPFQSSSKAKSWPPHEFFSWAGIGHWRRHPPCCWMRLLKARNRSWSNITDSYHEHRCCAPLGGPCRFFSSCFDNDDDSPNTLW